MVSITERIQECFTARGDSEYGGESVTQLEHALQCAWLAEQAGAAVQLIVASLLHDIGHLLHDLPVDAPERGIDDHHENSGYRFLEDHFPPSVTDPVRQHVAAKRFLCAVDPEYHARLSPPSVVSLRLQGGPMSAAEVDAFRNTPYWQDAVKLRRWDDQAKVADLKTPNLNYYLPLLEHAARSNAKRDLG